MHRTSLCRLVMQSALHAMRASTRRIMLHASINSHTWAHLLHMQAVAPALPLLTSSYARLQAGPSTAQHMYRIVQPVGAEPEQPRKACRQSAVYCNTCTSSISQQSLHAQLGCNMQQAGAEHC